VRACPKCLHRSWLLGALSGRLEYRGRDLECLISLLELSDGELVRALGAPELEHPQTEDAQRNPEQPPHPAGVVSICRHDWHYPTALAQTAGAPRALHVAGGIERLRELLAEPAVAIVGTRRASDYGLEVAHGLARGLAASGITVVSGLAEGIPAAAHAGALEVHGPTITVTAGGVDVCHPASKRSLHRHLQVQGCAVAELPCGCRPRGWCHTARSRIVVGLAQLVIVVEAGERPSELIHARLAHATGRAVAAVPGRLTSPVSRGPHKLLRQGALLVRSPQDVLDVLYTPSRRQAPSGHPDLEPQLQAMLEQVGSGRDTLAKLLAHGAHEPETLVALAKLELSGALARGDGGRYLPRL
jgi:DNA processing protein